MSVKLVVGCAVVFAAAGLLLAGSAAGQSTGPVQVSDVLEGGQYRQGGSSAARCGNNIVVGFTDIEPASPLDGAGVSVSKDGGRSFTDLGGIVDSDPNGDGFGGDNPVITCSSAGDFYYAAVELQDPVMFPITQISFSTSSDGGTTWASPVPASSGTNDYYGFSAPSMAVDPSNSLNLYVAYLNLNYAGPDTPDCPSQSYILEFVASHDGGQTWIGRPDPASPGTPNMQLDHACVTALQQPLTDPNVIVSPAGEIYVTYEVQARTAQGISIDEIRLVRSLDKGATFGAPQVVSRTAIDFASPHLTVDRTGSSHNGTVYLAWSGPVGASTDIWVSRSRDGGRSFDLRVPVSAPLLGASHYRLNPSIAVDKSGTIAACFDDTPDNPPTSNSVYSHLCATSVNQGLTWQVQQVANPVQVERLSCGGCLGRLASEGLATDFLQQDPGFFTTFEVQLNGNLYVYGKEIQPQ